MFNHNAYNLLLFCEEIKIWVELTKNGYDKSKAVLNMYWDSFIHVCMSEMVK